MKLCIALTLICFHIVVNDGLEFPNVPGVVYSAVHKNVTIPCGLDFPIGETVELILWYRDGNYIIHKEKNGLVKASDVALKNKFDIVDSQNTLLVTDVILDDSGNYMCKKHYMKIDETGVAMQEQNVTTQLIVQAARHKRHRLRKRKSLPDTGIPAPAPSVVENSTASNDLDLENVTYAGSNNSTSVSSIIPASTVVSTDVPANNLASDATSMTSSQALMTSSPVVSESTTTVAMATNDPDVPSAPGVPAVTNIKSRECVVSWQKSLYDNNSPIINYIIYVKSVEEDWKEGRILLVNGNTTSIIVRDLVPYTYYQIRVMAKNAMGNSEPSSDSSIFNTLGEYPEQPPANVRVSSPNSTTVRLEWELPEERYINGILQGFVVRYGEASKRFDLAFTIEDPSRRVQDIEKLRPFTNYSVTILLFNDVGNGPPHQEYIVTQEGVPNKPRITHFTDMKPTSLIVNWEAPTVVNGVLKNYQLQWIHNNTYKTRIITGHLTQPMRATIGDLEPYTEYQLRVRAETGGGYSEYSDLYPALTDVKGANAPVIVNLTVISPTSVFVEWRRPTLVYKTINSYFIQYHTLGDYTWSDEEMTDGSELKKVIKGLPTNRQYRLKVAAITQSIFSSANYYGDFSTEVEFQLEDPNIRPERTVDASNAGIIVGIVVAFAIILIVVVVFVACKSLTCRKYTQSLYYLAVPTNSQSPQSTVLFPPDTVDAVVSRYPEIRVCDFLRHNRDMHANSDDKFSEQFEEINQLSRTDYLAENSDLPENKHKNRYVNISAYDHSRVTLQQVPGRPKSSDYINANFIDGYCQQRAYIATQGPLMDTFADFWRMVWEYNSIVIVMITNLFERGRAKCDMYWPNEGVETYGAITVKHLNTISRAHYTVRLFSLKNIKNKKKQVSERIVYQYHYTEWPDHGVPEFNLPVLKFIQKSSSDNPPGAGPIVIHCSAGVGRTGTYILIESMIRQIKDKGSVNIPGFLLHIRTQRKSLVQTEEQYMLIHDAIAEYILTQGDTEVKEVDLGKHLAELTRQANGEMTLLEIQYNLVTSYNPQPDDMFHALKSVNLCKNRTHELVPLSVKRVCLPMIPGEDGSDYINATYLHGYNKTNEFIVTQHPLEQTMEDFWRMVWDQNSSIIVQLSPVDEKDFKSYWPAKDHPIDIGGNFKLTYREDDERRKYIIREFLLQSNQDDYILMTRVVTPYEPWPASCEPLSQVFDLVDEVMELHKHNDTMGPVVVMDRFGGVEAASFCALWTMYDQLQNDKSVNVYQLAKLYHLKRAGCIGTKEDYLFLYEAAESLSREWIERDRQSSPGSVRLHLGSKKNGTMPRSLTINSRIEHRQEHRAHEPQSPEPKVVTDV